MLHDLLTDHTRRVEQPNALPLHLREAPPLPNPGDVDRDTFLASILAPIRSGMILTRQDLARAARDTGLALRAGERRYALNALLDQDAPATWRWLESEANAWVQHHATHEIRTDDVQRFWSERASATAERFAEFTDEA